MLADMAVLVWLCCEVACCNARPVLKHALGSDMPSS